MINIEGFSGEGYLEVIQKIKKWQSEFADTFSLKPGTVKMYPKITHTEHYAVGHRSRLAGAWTEHFMTVVYELSLTPEVIVEAESQVIKKDGKPKIRSKKIPYSKHASVTSRACN